MLCNVMNALLVRPTTEGPFSKKRNYMFDLVNTSCNQENKSSTLRELISFLNLPAFSESQGQAGCEVHFKGWSKPILAACGAQTLIICMCWDALELPSEFKRCSLFLLLCVTLPKNIWLWQIKDPVWSQIFHAALLKGIFLLCNSLLLRVSW